MLFTHTSVHVCGCEVYVSMHVFVKGKIIGHCVFQ